MSVIQAGYLGGPNGKLYVSVFLPEGDRCPSRWVVHVPAFAEEMNKCRPMVSRQAHRLADDGFAVVVVDLIGTGDSEGEFRDADWGQWKNDLKYVIQWARNQGAAQITLWGMRLGCLLAADLSQDSCEPLAALLLWQPVHIGQQYMTQFLRLRMAASLMTGDSETVSQLRDRLHQGESIEVAGYLLSPTMLMQVEKVALSDLKIPVNVSVGILEVVNGEGKPSLPVTRKQVEQWQLSQVECCAAALPGEPFWMTQEIAFSPSLIAGTAEYLSRLCSQDEADSAGNPNTNGLAPLFSIPDPALGKEDAVVFSCEGEQLVGVLHRPNTRATCGVLIVVGGPQYRIGSHRQFVYLARALADEGIPVLRFDYRGMGDSTGELVGFEGVNADIRCAVDAFQSEVEDLTEVVIWGLCDAATAAAFYAAGDARVIGLVLVNPWVYSKKGAAKAYFKHYYLGRLFSKAFWKKLLRGEFNLVESAASVLSLAGNVMQDEPEGSLAVSQRQSASSPAEQSGDLVARFTDSLEKFTGEILFILSGNDLTAAEFVDTAANNRKLRKLMGRNGVGQVSLREADHTFSKREWAAEVELLTVKMLAD